ncbi:hypothetical protein SBADM41S_04052 [Streptomyces badius]
MLPLIARVPAVIVELLGERPDEDPGDQERDESSTRRWVHQDAEDEQQTVASSSGVMICQIWPSFAWLYWAVSLAVANAVMRSAAPPELPDVRAGSDGRAPLTFRPCRAARAASSPGA